MTIGGTRYVYTGRVTSMDEHHAAVFSPLLIGPDRRTTDRYPVPSVSCRLKEKGFLRPRVSTVFIVNISTGGAAVSCSGPLEVSKVCELETSLVVHRAPRDCSAVVSVRYCRPEKSHYICGVRFEEMTPSCRDTLEKFVRRLREEG